MPRLLMIAAWLVAAVAATGVAWTVLDSADREVGAVPAVAGVPVTTIIDDPTASPSPVTAPSSTAPSAAPTTAPSTTSGGASAADPPTGGPPSTTTSTTTSTAPTSAPSTTTSTAPTGAPSTTTTTTGPADGDTTTTVAWTSLTVPSGGGVVVVAHRPGEVRLESSTPAPGYDMEIDDRGPDEVRVEFEGMADEYRIRVRWRDGLLDVEVDHG